MNYFARLLFILTLSAANFVCGDEQPTHSKEPQEVQRHISRLAANDPEVRLQAMIALAQLGPKAKPAVMALTSALSDDDPRIRHAAATALGAIGEDAAPAVPQLTALLTDQRVINGQEPVWFAATKALGKIGAPAVPSLIDALEHEDNTPRRAAALALHLVGPEAKEAVPALIKLAERNDDETRREAIIGLAGIGPAAKSATPMLTEMLHHGDFHTQYQACRALASIGEDAKPALKDLIELTKTGNPSVRSNAALTLAALGPKVADKTIPHLTKLLKDPVEPVRERAVIALGKLGPAAKNAAPAIREALARSNPRLAARTQAAKTLWLITGDAAEAVPILLKELKSNNAPWDAAKVIAEIKPPAEKVVPTLTARLSSPDPDIRLACCQALLPFANDAQEAVEPLKKLTADEDEEVRKAAQAALKAIEAK